MSCSAHPITPTPAESLRSYIASSPLPHRRNNWLPFANELENVLTLLSWSGPLSGSCCVSQGRGGGSGVSKRWHVAPLHVGVTLDSCSFHCLSLAKCWDNKLVPSCLAYVSAGVQFSTPVQSHGKKIKKERGYSHCPSPGTDTLPTPRILTTLTLRPFSGVDSAAVMG